MQSDQRDDVTVLTFDGELNEQNLPTISAEIDGLIETGNRKLVFNFHRMTFIYSSALGYLIRTKKRVQTQAGDLVLVQPSAFVMKALTALGLIEFFDIFETDEEGVRFFHP